ncbi:hypothetical protein [uncultured Anaerococcus sp.]|uniref:hypothetical protein n=1 Tax=uncultured Anaerococcus sp. TaxID=293428 RepID=UPI0025DAD0D5|nr:hypothetical protein [uncultured Anaerococcus sp.]
MKKILILGILLTLTSCGFESKAEFEAKNTPKKSEEIEFPEIKYLPSTNSGSSSLDFEETYGKGKMGSAVAIEDAIGFLKDFGLGDNYLGISVLESSYSPDSFSAVLSFEKNDQLVEKEYGPVISPGGLFSKVSFDVIESDSGPVLLASQVVINEDSTSSAYFLYNKYMSLIDSFKFENSIVDPSTKVYRLGNLLETKQGQAYDLDGLIGDRLGAEDEHLGEILTAYNIKYKKIKASIDGNERSVGNMPSDPKNKILTIKYENEKGTILNIK